jgi:hypothetical protein
VGSVDEAAEFIDSQRAAVVSPIFLGVESGHTDQEVSPRSTVLPAPAGESPNRGSMAVHCLQGQSLVTKGLQSVLHAAGGKVGQSTDLGQGDHAAGVLGHLARMLRLVPPGKKRGAILNDVFLQGRCGMVPKRQFPGIENPRPDFGGLGFPVAGQFLRRPAVGATLFFTLHSVGIDESVIPDLATLAVRCHWVRLLLIPGVESGAGSRQRSRPYSPHCRRFGGHFHRLMIFDHFSSPSATGQDRRVVPAGLIERFPQWRPRCTSRDGEDLSEGFLVVEGFMAW